MKVALLTRFKRLITMENFKYPFCSSSSFDEEQHRGGFAEFSPNPTDMERILDGIDDARKILDLVNHHDLDHNKFTRPLFSELSTWTNMMKAYQQETIRLESRGRTRSTMTMGDWRSHLIHIGRLVLADLKWFSLSHMGELKQNEKNTDKIAPETRNDQFQTLIYCVRARPDSFCDIYSAYTEIYRLLCKRLYPPITQVLFFQWLLAFFELVIKVARHNDSPEAMKQWVDKSIKEGYLSPSVFGVR